MSHGLPAPPPEPGAVRSLDFLAPKLRIRIVALLDDMERRDQDASIAESLRSDERQSWLYGMGREYDDGRGVVTMAPTAVHSWHWYGLAVDITSLHFGDNAPGVFWYHLGKVAKSYGLTWGGDWPRFTDRPHVQWGPPMRQAPSSRAVELKASGGNAAVWKEVGAA